MQRIDNRLSERMKMVAGLLTKGKRVADIGCDHAFVSMYLLESGISERVYAMDLREGPLKIAADNIRNYGYAGSDNCDKKIETRLSDGFEMLEPGETNAAIIAGMGGPVIISILDKGSKSIVRKDKTERSSIINEGYELVIQPQSELDLVRKYLRTNGYEILDEKMIYEEGKYYTAIKILKTDSAVKTKSEPYTDLYGDILIKKKDSTFKAYLENERDKKLMIVRNLDSKLSERNVQRMKELDSEIDTISRILRELE